MKWYDDHHICDYNTAMEIAPSRKALTHERILDTAARAIRRAGFQGVGVADIMKEAGLTHGGFYAHFASRDLNRPTAIAAQNAVSRKSSASSLGWAIQPPATDPSSVPPTQGRNMARPEPST